MALVEAISIEAELHAQMDRVADLWDANPSIRQLLQDHYPGEWQRIEACRQSWVVKQKRGTEYYRVAPRRSCHRIPYCIVCTRKEEWRRAFRLLEVLHRCKPPEERVAAVHIVQTAPYTEDGQGWGRVARRYPKAFAKIVHGALEGAYGGSVGAVHAYQDFGERPFTKPHPHVDGIVNGWILRDDKPVPLPRMELMGGSDEAWHERIVEGAQALELGASKGSFSLSPRIEGEGPLLKVARYALREMVNFCQLEYDRGTQTVEWLDYKTKNRETYKVLDWKAGLAEYEWRLGQGGARRKPLSSYYGDLSKTNARRVQAAMGGVEREHSKGCPCGTCADWDALSWEEVDARIRQAGGSWANIPDVTPRRVVA